MVHNGTRKLLWLRAFVLRIWFWIVCKPVCRQETKEHRFRLQTDTHTHSIETIKVKEKCANEKRNKTNGFFSLQVKLIFTLFKTIFVSCLGISLIENHHQKNSTNENSNWKRFHLVSLKTDLAFSRKRNTYRQTRTSCYLLYVYE